VPKHQRNFVQICEEFVKEKYPDESLSAFILDCVRDKINSLSREDKKLFEKQAYKLAKKEKPSTSDFVDKFIKNM
jgi:rRNA-processing protein FCF1